MRHLRHLVIAGGISLLALTGCVTADSSPATSVAEDAATTLAVATEALPAATDTEADTATGTETEIDDDGAAADVSVDTTAGTTEGTSDGATAVDVAPITWDESAEVHIALTGDSADAGDGVGEGVEVDGSTITIVAPGTYRVSGTLDDGQIVVDVPDDGVVRLVLDGVDITSSTTSAIAVMDADEAVVMLADGSQNVLSDAGQYVYPDAGTDEPNAVLFSAADLTVAGNGSLHVSGNSNDGIASKDSLTIAGGTITVTAVDDGIRGKDTLVIDGATVTVEAAGDGLKADNDEDASLGNVSVLSGTVAVAAGDDGVHAEGVATIAGGAIAVTTSYEGIEGDEIVISGGDVSIVSSDDGINAMSYLTVSGGTVAVEAGGDGVDVNGSISMTGGTLVVDGPTEQMNGAIDYDGTFDISGGLVVATGSDGMLQAPSGDSSQLSIAATFTTQSAGTVIHVQSTDGTDIVTFTPTKAYSAIVVSSADLSADATYEIVVGGQTIASTTTAEANAQGGPGGGPGAGPGGGRRP